MMVAHLMSRLINASDLETPVAKPTGTLLKDPRVPNKEDDTKPAEKDVRPMLPLISKRAEQEALVAQAQ